MAAPGRWRSLLLISRLLERKDERGNTTVASAWQPSSRSPSQVSPQRTPQSHLSSFLRWLVTVWGWYLLEVTSKYPAEGVSPSLFDSCCYATNLYLLSISKCILEHLRRSPTLTSHDLGLFQRLCKQQRQALTITISPPSSS